MIAPQELKKSSSLIGHIYVYKSCNITHSGILDIAFSDRLLISTTRKLGVKLPPLATYKTSNFCWKHFNPTSFQRHVRFTNWQDIYLHDSSEGMLDAFTTKLRTIIDCHLKVKTKLVKSKSLPPWLDQEVYSNMQQRDHLKRCHKWDAYKQLRNYTTNLIKRKKKEYISNLVKNNQGKQTKHLWDALRNTSADNTTPSWGNQSAHPNLDIANALNTHFTNISKINNNTRIHDNLPISTPITPDQDHTLKNLPFIDLCQLTFYLYEIKPGKATGSDGISVKLLRLAFPFIGPLLCDIINRSIHEGSFSYQWKQAIVTPLYKRGDKED